VKNVSIEFQLRNQCAIGGGDVKEERRKLNTEQTRRFSSTERELPDLFIAKTDAPSKTSKTVLRTAELLLDEGSRNRFQLHPRDKLCFPTTDTTRDLALQGHQCECDEGDLPLKL
jgi:hypothetical protein